LGFNVKGIGIIKMCKILTCILLGSFVVLHISDITFGLDSAITHNEWQKNALNQDVNVKDTESRSKRNTSKKKLIEERDCTEEIKRLCGTLPRNSDDLFVLECIQSFKVSVIQCEKCT
jgi:hypothetical protein